MQQLHRFPSRILTAIALLFCAGCATLPDTAPFANATAALRGAVQSSGAAVVSELKMTQLPAATEHASTLESAWKERNKAMSALVDYANSLQAVTAAGNDGAASASRLVDAADVLVSALGSTHFAAGAGASLARDAFIFANEQIAKARAAKSLEASLAALQPAIERVAELFSTDLTALHEIAVVALRLQLHALQSENQQELAYRNQLLATRRNLMAAIQTDLADNKPPSTLSHAKEVEQLDRLLSQMENWHAEFSRQQAMFKQRERVARELMISTRDAFDDWSAAHARLLAGVRTKQIPSVAEVMEAAGRIHVLVERYRSL